jgi:type IV secretion system protein VirB5
VDKLGRVAALGPADRNYHPTDPMIAYYLGQFVWDVRTVSTDGVIVRNDWQRAYKFVTDKGYAALNSYARADDPFVKVKSGLPVEVDVRSVVRASENSFQVIWIERHYRDGALVATEHWRAFLTVVISPPSDPDPFKVNPLGIYVDAINWSKELG